MARPAPVPPPWPEEGEHREPADGGGPEPQALARRHRLGPAPRPVRGPAPPDVPSSDRRPPAPSLADTASAARTRRLLLAIRPPPAAFVTGLAPSVAFTPTVPGVGVVALGAGLFRAPACVPAGRPGLPPPPSPSADEARARPTWAGPPPAAIGASPRGLVSAGSRTAAKAAAVRAFWARVELPASDGRPFRRPSRRPTTPRARRSRPAVRLAVGSSVAGGARALGLVRARLHHGGPHGHRRPQLRQGGEPVPGGVSPGIAPVRRTPSH